MNRILTIALGFVLAVTLASPAAHGQAAVERAQPGKTAELAADWWIWAVSKPQAENPLLGGEPEYTDEQCDGRPVGDAPGKRYFLAGTLDGSPVTRTCTVPRGSKLFFPVANTAFFITEPDETEEDARRYVNEYMDNALEDPDLRVVVKVDGKKVEGQRIDRADSPLFTVEVPEDGLLPAGSYDAVADGLWVSLPPLPRGEHTVRFSIDAPNAEVSQNNTYHLTVAR